MWVVSPGGALEILEERVQTHRFERHTWHVIGWQKGSLGRSRQCIPTWRFTKDLGKTWEKKQQSCHRLSRKKGCQSTNQWYRVGMKPSTNFEAGNGRSLPLPLLSIFSTFLVFPITSCVSASTHLCTMLWELLFQSLSGGRTLKNKDLSEEGWIPLAIHGRQNDQIWVPAARHLNPYIGTQA